MTNLHLLGTSSSKSSFLNHIYHPRISKPRPNSSHHTNHVYTYQHQTPHALPFHPYPTCTPIHFRLPSQTETRRVSAIALRVADTYPILFPPPAPRTAPTMTMIRAVVEDDSVGTNRGSGEGSGRRGYTSISAIAQAHLCSLFPSLQSVNNHRHPRGRLIPQPIPPPFLAPTSLAPDHSVGTPLSIHLPFPYPASFSAPRHTPPPSPSQPQGS